MAVIDQIHTDRCPRPKIENKGKRKKKKEEKKTFTFVRDCWENIYKTRVRLTIVFNIGLVRILKKQNKTKNKVILLHYLAKQRNTRCRSAFKAFTHS